MNVADVYLNTKVILEGVPHNIAPSDFFKYHCTDPNAVLIYEVLEDLIVKLQADVAREDELNTEIEELNEEMDTLRMDIRDKEDVIDDLEQTNKQLQETIGKLEEELEESLKE